ncbi:MAG: sigma-70 family RNA polymerase sigma factor [Clostridia bacterium]|nr:sigma-70 family RNA polymerase sigma factor [Clostridia bacterium]
MTLLELYTEEYLGKIFYFALKKTGNPDDADDLASDVSLAVVAALRGGREPENFDAWVWAVARNRWKRFARRRYYGPEAEAESLEDAAETIPGGEEIDESLVLSEDLGLLRRELAFIRSDYRQILVAHYFENKSVSAIAREFSIPLGTVKTKLQSSRRKLKEGMEMARTFGKRSYQPEEVTFVKNGRDGDKGQPWSILTHLLYKNIFLEAHENPSTAEELSLELGIALPYMEDELEFLVREELLKKTGNRYETAFRIVSREEQRHEHEQALVTSKAAVPKIEAWIDAFHAACERNGIDWIGPWVSYEDAKWTLLIRAFDCMAWEMQGMPEDRELPLRPDNGRWEVTGYEIPDFERPDFVGQHGFVDPDDKFNDHGLTWSQYKYHYYGLCDATPVLLTYQEALTIWKTAVGRGAECEEAMLQKVCGYGYLRKTENGYEPAVVVFCGSREKIMKMLPEAEREPLDTLWHDAVDALRPVSFRSYVLEEALATGWLKYEEGKTPATVGAYLYR